MIFNWAPTANSWTTFPWSSAWIWVSWLHTVVLDGSWYVTQRYLNNIQSVGASPVVQGRLSSRIQAENMRRKPFLVISTCGFSSPSFKKSAIISVDFWRFIWASIVMPHVGFDSFFASKFFFPLHDDTWVTRLFNFGHFGSSSKFMFDPLSVCSKVHVLLDGKY